MYEFPLRDGIDNGGSAEHDQTSIFNNHNLRLKNAYLREVVACAERKLMLAACGIDDISPLERFAILVLGCQAEYRTGVKITNRG